MKKLLTFAAIALVAAATQAATIAWTGAGATAYAGGDYSVFVIGVNGVTSVDQIVDLVAAGTDTSSYAFGYGTVQSSGTTGSATATSGAGSITYSGSGTDTYSAFLVVWSADGTSASYSSTATISMTNDSTTQTIKFANQSSSYSANAFSVGPVPEPTTVALLALGLAALGLKRKVA